MNTESLKTFITIAELKNFTHAAHKHNVVQSTITTRIKDLEDDLGVPLFNRNNRSVALTEQGARFLTYAKQIIKCEESAREDLLAENVFDEQIKIGVAHSLYDGMQNSILLFLSQFKNVSVDIRLTDSMQTIWNLTDDQIDVAIVFSPFSGSQVVCKQFRQEELLLVTSHKNALKRVISIEEFEKLPLAVTMYSVENAPAWYSLLFKDFRRMNFKTNSGIVLADLLKESHFYSILPRSCVKADLDSGALVSIEIDGYDMPVLKSYLLYKDKSLQKASCIKDFIDFMECHK